MGPASSQLNVGVQEWSQNRTWALQQAQEGCLDLSIMGGQCGSLHLSRKGPADATATVSY